MSIAQEEAIKINKNFNYLKNAKKKGVRNSTYETKNFEGGDYAVTLILFEDSSILSVELDTKKAKEIKVGSFFTI